MYHVRRRWLENTTSRQAFYQVFEIRSETNSRRVVVAHYGRLSIAAGKFSRPVVGGNVKVLGLQYMAAIQAKRKGDYQDVGERDDAPLETDAQLANYLTAEFGATHTHAILQALGLIGTSMSLGDDESEPPPPLEPDYSSSVDDDELAELLDPRRGSW
jgi:hypothetical protein